MGYLLACIEIQAVTTSLLHASAHKHPLVNHLLRELAVPALGCCNRYYTSAQLAVCCGKQSPRLQALDS
jgi:hypothetical protein